MLAAVDVPRVRLRRSKNHSGLLRSPHRDAADVHAPLLPGSRHPRSGLRRARYEGVALQRGRLGQATRYGPGVSYFQRFWTYATQVLFHFNLGRSFKENSSVWGIISLYVPRTIWLAAVSLALTTIIAIPLGIFQAARRNTVGDYTATGAAFVLYAMPSFFSCACSCHRRLQLPLAAPTEHSPPAGVAGVGDVHQSQRLHTAGRGVDSCLSVAGLSRYMRGTVLEVLVQDYVTHRQGQGLQSLSSDPLRSTPFATRWGPIMRRAVGTLHPRAVPGAVP